MVEVATRGVGVTVTPEGWVRYRSLHLWLFSRWLPQYCLTKRESDVPFWDVQRDLLVRYSQAAIALPFRGLIDVIANVGDIYSVRLPADPIGGYIYKVTHVPTTKGFLLGQVWGCDGLVVSDVGLCSLQTEEQYMIYDSLLTVVLHRSGSPPIQAALYFNTPKMSGMLELFPDGSGLVTGNGLSHQQVVEAWTTALSKGTVLCGLTAGEGDAQCHASFVNTIDLLRKAVTFMDEARGRYPDGVWPVESEQYKVMLTVTASQPNGG